MVLGALGLLEGTNASAWAESELGIRRPLACRTKPLLSLEEHTLMLTQNRIKRPHQGLTPSLPVPELILPDIPFVL